MHIKKRFDQYRRDFMAVYACFWCGYEFTGSGYDDDNFHSNVIPAWPCSQCGQKGGGPGSDTIVPAGVVL